MGPKNAHKSKNITKKALRVLKKEKILATSEELTTITKNEVQILKTTAIPSAVQETALKLSTLTIAIPGSIIENAQTLELRSYLAGQIARAACIYRVDEIVVFDDLGEVCAHEKYDEIFDGFPSRQCCIQLARILQYLECPQYLRKHLFPLHPDFSKIGVVNPLAAPHHLHQDEYCCYREGVIVKRPTNKGSYVNIGLRKECYVKQHLQPGIRVTVRLDENCCPTKKNLFGHVVSPRLAKHHVGYWGYRVRIANSLSEIFSRCPYPNGYDMLIGTSDKGQSVDDLSSLEYDHALLVFGGLHGLEKALESDSEQLTSDPSLLFDYYVNACPSQGSRTIRTEEALLITLAELRNKLTPRVPPPLSSIQTMFTRREPSAAVSNNMSECK